MGTPAKKCTIQSTLHLMITYSISIYHHISAYIIISVMIFGYIQLSNDNCSCTTSDQATIFHQNCPKTDQTRSWSPSIIRSHQVGRKDANQPPKPTNSIREIPSICQPHHVSMNQPESINNQHAWCLFSSFNSMESTKLSMILNIIQAYWTTCIKLRPFRTIAWIHIAPVSCCFPDLLYFYMQPSSKNQLLFQLHESQKRSVKETMALEIPNTNSPHRYVWGVNTQSNFKKS